MASIRAVRVSVSKQWLIGEHLHVTSEGIHVVSTAAIKAVERAMEKNNFIVKSSICQIIWVSWSFLDIKGIEILCEEKQVNIILSGIFVCYINTVSLFWHDLIFDRSHGSELFDSDVVKASRFGEQAFERPCIRSGLAVLNSSMPCIVW